MAIQFKSLGRGGGGLVDWAADSGPNSLSSIPLGEKKEIKRKKSPGLAYIWKNLKLEMPKIVTYCQISSLLADNTT